MDEEEKKKDEEWGKLRAEVKKHAETSKEVARGIVDQEEKINKADADAKDAKKIAAKPLGVDDHEEDAKKAALV